MTSANQIIIMLIMGFTTTNDTIVQGIQCNSVKALHGLQGRPFERIIRSKACPACNVVRSWRFSVALAKLNPTKRARGVKIAGTLTLQTTLSRTGTDEKDATALELSDVGLFPAVNY